MDNKIVFTKDYDPNLDLEHPWNLMVEVMGWGGSLGVILMTAQVRTLPFPFWTFEE